MGQENTVLVAFSLDWIRGNSLFAKQFLNVTSPSSLAGGRWKERNGGRNRER